MAHLVLYDGLCALCNRTVQFILRRDRADQFRFAPLQGAFAKAILAKHNQPTESLDTVYVVADFEAPHERLLKKSRAVLFSVHSLSWTWRWVWIFTPIPTRILDWCYDAVAKRRYRWFGKFDSCPTPRDADRVKFIASDYPN